MSKSKKRIKQMMAKGISRNDAKVFNRVRRQIICAKDEKLRAMLPKVTDPVVPHTVCNYQTRKFRAECLLDPYQLEMVGKEHLEEYIRHNLSGKLIDSLWQNGFIKLEGKQCNNGYIQYRLSLMVALPGETIVYGE